MLDLKTLTLALCLGALAFTGCIPDPDPEKTPTVSKTEITLPSSTPETRQPNQNKLPADAPKTEAEADKAARKVLLDKAELPDNWVPFNILDDSEIGTICGVDILPIKPVVGYNSSWANSAEKEKKPEAFFTQAFYPVGATQANKTITEIQSAITDCKPDASKTEIKEFKVADKDALGVAMKYDGDENWRCRAFFVSNEFLMVFTVFSEEPKPKNDLLDKMIAIARAKAAN